MYIAYCDIQLQILHTLLHWIKRHHRQHNFQLRVNKGRARKADLIKVEKLISTIHNLALSSSRTYIKKKRILSEGDAP